MINCNKLRISRHNIILKYSKLYKIMIHIYSNSKMINYSILIILIPNTIIKLMILNVNTLKKLNYYIHKLILSSNTLNNLRMILIYINSLFQIYLLNNKCKLILFMNQKILFRIINIKLIIIVIHKIRLARLSYQKNKICSLINKFNRKIIKSIKCKIKSKNSFMNKKNN